jgi:hypothetical protein
MNAMPNQQPYRAGFVLRVAIKTLLLVLAFNVVFIALKPLPTLGAISIYNRLVAGRPRLPYGENPAQSYNLSLQNIPALLASHQLSGTTKTDREFRVLLIGDSSVWGVLLSPAETLAGQLNAANLQSADGRQARFYNLGYPVQSLTKDLLILQAGLAHKPDLIIWLFTPEAFAPNQQTDPALVRQNPGLLQPLVAQYNLPINLQDSRFVQPTLIDQSIWGQRRALADLLRLQLYGLAWQASQHDQTYPRQYVPRMEHFDDMDHSQWQGQTNLEAIIPSLNILRAGIALAAPVPVLLVNEPMFISNGRGSDQRYNFFYPRWVVDSFNQLLPQQAAANRWPYANFWDLVAGDQFTDSAVHMTPAGTAQLAQQLWVTVMANGLDGVLTAQTE